jgi:tRNA A37 N6-isopentenylltransferase MiaA
MDDLSIAQAKINQLTRRIEELEEIVRVAREHALDQQTQNDLLEQDATNRCFCEKCEEYLHERYCADCYAEMVSENEEDEMSDDDTQPNSPASKIIQD